MKWMHSENSFTQTAPHLFKMNTCIWWHIHCECREFGRTDEMDFIVISWLFWFYFFSFCFFVFWWRMRNRNNNEGKNIKYNCSTHVENIVFNMKRKIYNFEMVELISACENEWIEFYVPNILELEWLRPIVFFSIRNIFNLFETKKMHLTLIRILVQSVPV